MREKHVPTAPARVANLASVCVASVMRIITLRDLDNDDLPCRSVHFMLRSQTYK